MIGPAFWTSPHQVLPPYFYDGYLTAGMPPYTASDGETPLVQSPDASGTTFLWRPYRSGDVPRALSRYSFTFSVEAITEDDFYRFQRARSLAEPVWFIPGMRVGDTFDVEAGATVTLSRPRAAAAGVGGVTESSHPTSFWLNGSSVTAPGSWDDGQNFTVDGSTNGVLQIVYTPAFRVWVSSFPENIPLFNAVDAQITIEEVTQI